jgi:hypothetical protein
MGLIPHAEELAVETLKNAREALYRSAKRALQVDCITRDEWESEPEIVAYARRYGIEHELTHISAVAS